MDGPQGTPYDSRVLNGGRCGFLKYFTVIECEPISFPEYNESECEPFPAPAALTVPKAISFPEYTGKLWERDCPKLSRDLDPRSRFTVGFRMHCFAPEYHLVKNLRNRTDVFTSASPQNPLQVSGGGGGGG
jgi:hypothetical protein